MSTFKKVIKRGADKKQDGVHGSDGGVHGSGGEGHEDVGVVPGYGIGLTVDDKDIVYTDESVCRMLDIRRRVLGDARTKTSLGRDWGYVNEEVGMTRRWIEDYALEHGTVADFEKENGFVKVDGKYVSLRLVGTTPNNCLCLVEVEATGKREYCRIRNIKLYPIHYKEVFGAVRVNLQADPHLEWISTANTAKY